MYVCVCVCVHTYVYMYTHTYMHTHTHTHFARLNRTDLDVEEKRIWLTYFAYDLKLKFIIQWLVESPEYHTLNPKFQKDG